MDSINNTPITQFLLSKAAALNIPVSGTFELSPVCNFSCRMCYIRKTQKEVNAHTRPQVTLEQWLELAKDAKEKGTLFLLLTGGEPFLWTDFWRLYEELIRMGFLISINSNASMIDEQVVRRLKKLPPKRINITLYGASDETYEALCGVKGVFEKVDRGIQMLLDAGIAVRMNCSLTPANAGDLKAITDYAKEKNVTLKIAGYMFPPLRRTEEIVTADYRFTPKEYAEYMMKSHLFQQGEEAYQEILKLIKYKTTPPPGLEEFCQNSLNGSIKCQAGKTNFWVTWDGYLTPCGMMPEPKIDLYQYGFSESWDYLVEQSEQVAVSGTCNTCPNQKFCHSCAAVAMAETGTSEGIPTYLCKTVEELQRIADEKLTDEIENLGKGEKEK